MQAIQVSIAVLPSRPMLTAETLHELRQSLSSIEAIAYFLEMTIQTNPRTDISPPTPAARSHYLQEIQRLAVKLSDDLTARVCSGSRTPVA